MANETSRYVDNELLTLRGGLFAAADPALAGPPLIDVDVVAPPTACAAPRRASVDRTGTWPARGARAGSARRASWAVAAAAGAALIGGLAAASQVPSAVTSPPMAPAPLALPDGANAVAARPPARAPLDPEPAATAPRVQAASGARAVRTVHHSVAAAPPADRGAPRALRAEGPPRTPTRPLVRPAVWPSPLEALGAQDMAFSAPSAALAIASAAGHANGCTILRDPKVWMRVRVTFAPSGRASSAAVTSGPFAGTDVGRCIAGALHVARMRPFEGSPVIVTTSIHLS